MFSFPKQSFYYVDLDNACIRTETGFILNDREVVVEREDGLVSRTRNYLHLTEKAATKELLKLAKSQAKYFKETIKHVEGNRKKQAEYDDGCIKQWENSIKLWEGLVPKKKKKPKN